MNFIKFHDYSDSYFCISVAQLNRINLVSKCKRNSQYYSEFDSVIFTCKKELKHIYYSLILTNASEHHAFCLYNSQSSEDELTMPCLGLLANLCRHNLSVQTQIKTLVS